MKITLYLPYRLIDLYLPSQVSGGIVFDEDPNVESKLINIEAIQGKWCIKSTEDTKVIVSQSEVELYALEIGEDIILKRYDKYYLIKVNSIFDETFSTFTYTSPISISIGNQSNCNIAFSSNYISNKIVNINIENDKISLVKSNDLMVYVNKLATTKSETNINFGSMINIYGLKIFITNGIIMINNPLNLVQLNLSDTGLIKLSHSDEKCENIEVIDTNLYDEKSYFSKSPRIRRTIEEEELKIDKPPALQEPNETPAILVYGPVLTLAMTSTVTLLTTINNLIQGQTTLANSWPRLMSGCLMLVSSILWPNLTKSYTKHVQKVKENKMLAKYDIYLKDKIKELETMENKQREILVENLISPVECLKIINRRGLNFWDKRIDQSDLMEARIGFGDEKLKVKIDYPEEGFTMDESLIKEKAEAVVKAFEYIKGVPIGYNFSDNKVTAIMGANKRQYFIDNIVLQFITYYSYEDLKIVLFTNQENSKRWEYIKYLNHNFTNDKNFRMYADDMDSTKLVADFILGEIGNRIQNNTGMFKPYYFIIIDDLTEIKKHDLLKIATELDINLGYSMVILEDSIQKLPSKCNNFISLGERTSGILINSYDSQEQITFMDEINYDINMFSVAKSLANIPIEFAEAKSELPSAITFLEMEKVGRVEQLNILNRWLMNDSTNSLKAEIGVDGNGDLIYLDLHEKYHGPHGLIAGTTGSGKSEFIITYILSLAMNFSPDDVAFVLIDYKGGGLAYAFENKTTGVILPHLAGTITNLDKSEMDRTLTSIDSEVKRRQRIFNEARDRNGESTIDIYKYQRLFKDGKVNEPCPHLFIICDEFAELKSQQPDFMDNLISIARIGRSLGVHLILATQKPSGVVNEQIWSNTKFRVCLKVADEGDSREMLKRNEAAFIKEAGRFYLQVGQDEIFVQGQSGWCGAKYYPSDKIIKKVDKSVNIINNNGLFIKSIQAGSSQKTEPQGEQLSAIMNNIIKIANETEKHAKRLWLDNISEKILIDNIKEKYNIKKDQTNIKAIIGEYDAPEKQEQGLVDISLTNDGNVMIAGTELTDRELMFKAIIYSLCTTYSPEEINIYIMDYGSGVLGVTKKYPQVGGIVTEGDTDKYNSFIKMMNETIQSRKKLLGEMGIDFKSYNNRSDVKKMSAIIVMINAMEVLTENDMNVNDELIKLTRDTERYGIYYIINHNGIGTSRRLMQNFNNILLLRFNDPTKYRDFFPVKINIYPKNVDGRGLIMHDIPHEFQTAMVTENAEEFNQFIELSANKQKEQYTEKAIPIPSLPEKITYEDIEAYVKTVKKVPIGIIKENLDIVKYNFTKNPCTTISSKSIKNIEVFTKSLTYIFSNIKNVSTILIDTEKLVPEVKENVNNYYDDNIENTIKKITEFVDKYDDSKDSYVIIIVYGLVKLKEKLSTTSILEDLTKKIKTKEKIKLIYCEEEKKIKMIDLEKFYTELKNKNDGIWIGKGFDTQSVFNSFGLSSRDNKKNIPNNQGYVLIDGEILPLQIIEFYEEKVDEDEE